MHLVHIIHIFWKAGDKTMLWTSATNTKVNVYCRVLKDKMQRKNEKKNSLVCISNLVTSATIILRITMLSVKWNSWREFLSSISTNTLL